MVSFVVVDIRSSAHHKKLSLSLQDTCKRSQPTCCGLRREGSGDVTAVLLSINGEKRERADEESLEGEAV